MDRRKIRKNLRKTAFFISKTLTSVGLKKYSFSIGADESYSLYVGADESYSLYVGHNRPTKVIICGKQKKRNKTG
jgi:hypothetical protein